MLDMIINLKEIMETAEMMKESADYSSGEEGFSPMDLVMGMLTPEQQETFRMYNAMFSQTADNLSLIHISLYKPAHQMNSHDAFFHIHVQNALPDCRNKHFTVLIRVNNIAVSYTHLCRPEKRICLIQIKLPIKLFL